MQSRFVFVNKLHVKGDKQQKRNELNIKKKTELRYVFLPSLPLPLSQINTF